MKMVMLMVLFATVAEPEPFEHPDFAPRLQQDMATCLKRRSFMQGYLEQQVPRHVQFFVFCVEFRAIGYDEAIAAFRRRIGQEM